MLRLHHSIFYRSLRIPATSGHICISAPILDFCFANKRFTNNNLPFYTLKYSFLLNSFITVSFIIVLKMMSCTIWEVSKHGRQRHRSRDINWRWTRTNCRGIILWGSLELAQSEWCRKVIPWLLLWPELLVNVDFGLRLWTLALLGAERLDIAIYI